MLTKINNQLITEPYVDMKISYLTNISQVRGTLSNDQMSHFSIALALLLEELYTKSCKLAEKSDHATILAKG